jgi:F-type H+-transporting ATPase subunit a
VIIDLFSALDPGVRSLFSFGIVYWVFIFLSLILFLRFWVKIRNYRVIIYLAIYFIVEQSRSTKRVGLKGFITFLGALFLIMLNVNLIGLIPYRLGASSHLIYTLAFGLRIWLGIILSSATKHLFMFLIGFVPEGVPIYLAPFLVLIEMVRVGVRPVTLSFRMAANLRTGHVVLGLLGRSISTMLVVGGILRLVFLIVMVGYIMFEVFVSLMQAYIFCLLLRLYINEHRR